MRTDDTSIVQKRSTGTMNFKPLFILKTVISILRITENSWVLKMWETIIYKN